MMILQKHVFTIEYLKLKAIRNFFVNTSVLKYENIAKKYDFRMHGILPV